MSQSKRQTILDFLKGNQSGVQVYPAEVLSKEGNTCTVRLLSSEMEIEDVRLIADPDASERIVFYPRVGSTVLVGCIEDQLSTLYVAQVTEIDGFDIIIGDAAIGGDKNSMVIVSDKTSVTVDKDKLTLSQNQVEIKLGSGKVSVTNGAVDLKALFTGLTTLLKTFVVITPSGPSTAVSPTSLTSIIQLEAKINALLS